jgi:hypothetical protein
MFDGGKGGMLSDQQNFKGFVQQKKFYALMTLFVMVAVDL